MSLQVRNQTSGALERVAGFNDTDTVLSATSRNPIQNKAVFAALTQKVEKTVNDLVYYYNTSQVYNKTEVRELIGAINTLTIEVVAQLPISDISTTTIYFVGPATGTNTYDEYVYVNDAWVKIGDTDIDLTDYITNANLTTILQSYYTKAEINNLLNSYYTKSEVNAELDTKQDTLTFDTTPTAGSNNPVTSNGIKNALNSLDVTALSTKFNNSVDLQGVKNILPYPYSGPVTSVSSGGITWTDNGDGTVTASGVATALSMFYVIFKQTTDLYKDECYVSGVPANAPNGCTISYRIGIQEGDKYYSGTDVQPGQEKTTVAFDGSTYWLHVYLRIAEGTDCTTPVTFKPMIRRKDTGGTNIWTPYAMTNQQLSKTVEIPITWNFPEGMSADYNYSHCYKIGKICILSISMRINAPAANTTYNIGSIPTSCILPMYASDRPSANGGGLSISGRYTGNTGNIDSNVYSLGINSFSGTIFFRSSVVVSDKSNHFICGNFVFPTK